MLGVVEEEGDICGGWGWEWAQWAIVCSGVTVTPRLWVSTSFLSSSYWAGQISRYMEDEFIRLLLAPSALA